MTMRTALSLAVALSLLGCLNDLGVTPTQSSSEMPDAEYAVLAAIIDSVIARPSDSLFVLGDSTRSGIFEYDHEGALTRVLSHMSQHVPALTAETMQDFTTKNLTSTYILEPQKIHPKCVRSGSTTRTFPMLEVSRVGFSADGQQALAYVGHSDMPLSGGGIYYVLSRPGGKWTILGSLMIWIS